MTFIKKLYDNFEEYACALFVAVMIICLMLQVLVRAFGGSSLAWTEELSRFCFIFSVFVGCALAVKHGGHVRITAQFSKLGTQGRLFFRFLADALWIGFNLYFAVVCWDTLKEGFEFPEISPTLGVVKAQVELVIPICFLLTSWRIIEQYIKHWRAGTLASLVNYEESA